MKKIVPVLKQDILYIYTDGGIKPGEIEGRGQGGVGVVAAVQDKNGENGIRIVAKMSHFFATNVTNQQMEILAAAMGLRLAAQLRREYAEVFKDGAPPSTIIRSDSAYVVNCMKEGWWYNWITKTGWKNSAKKPVENQDEWLELLSASSVFYTRLNLIRGLKLSDRDMAAFREAKNGVNCSFEKVRGHVGEYLNEIADQLATAGKNGASELLIF